MALLPFECDDTQVKIENLVKRFENEPNPTIQQMQRSISELAVICQYLLSDLRKAEKRIKGLEWVVDTGNS